MPVALALLVFALTPAAVPAGQPPLRVLAAASLADVVPTLAASYSSDRVQTSFAGSSALARQIRDGAPADVFVSASPAWMDFLRDAGALAGDPVRIARNRLVCVAPRGSALADRDVRDPASLLAALAAGELVAIADEGVPAGEYARDALRHVDVLDAFRRRLVGQKDVRAVLHAVERGELSAGFVYATDAAIAAVDVLFVVDPATHPPIEYSAAVLRDARAPAAARRFLDHLRGPAARSILAAAGFASP